MKQAGKSTFHSPHSKFDDGVFQILLVRGKISRYRLTRILLALEHGGHVDMPGLEWITCTAFRLEPDDENYSYNDVDGECVERGPIQGTSIKNGFSGIWYILETTPLKQTFRFSQVWFFRKQLSILVKWKNKSVYFIVLFSCHFYYFPPIHSPPTLLKSPCTLDTQANSPSNPAFHNATIPPSPDDAKTVPVTFH
jgi:hypothetical protein